MKYNNYECYCGSKLKYKRCHKIYEYKKPASEGEIGASFSDWNSVSCMHFQADSKCGNSIGAHSVPMSSGLLPLADKGHVLTYFAFNQFKDEALIPKKVGIKKASVFDGFCAYHDNETFKQADCLDQGSIIGFSQNIYRSMVYEKFKKINAIRRVPVSTELIKRGMGYEEQKELDRKTKIQMLGLNAGVETLDFNILKAINCLNGRAVPSGFCVRVMGPPLIAMSASYSPEYNIRGVKIQSLLNLNPKSVLYISLVAFFKDGYNYLMMGSIDNSPLIKEYLRQAKVMILEKYYAGLALAFNYCENVYFSQVFYDLHEKNDRLELARFVENMNANLRPFVFKGNDPIRSKISSAELVFEFS